MASSEPKKKTSNTTAEKAARAPRRARGQSVSGAEVGGPVPPLRDESATTRPATEGGQAPASAAETVETYSDVTEQHGWRTTRTRRTTTSEAKTVEPDGRKRTETTLHVDEVEDVVPVPYQGPAAPAGHPRPAG